MKPKVERFAATCDRTGLHALQVHFGHVSLAMTDRGYVGTDFALDDLIDRHARDETRAALEELLTASALGGKGGHTISGRSQFRGRTRDGEVQAYVDFLMAETDLRLGVCDWGYCVYREETSACLGNEKGPNPILRTESVCATCANFAVTGKHRPVWERRRTRNKELLEQQGLDPQSRALAQARIIECDGIWVSRHKRVYAPKAPLSSELAAEVAALKKERDGLEQSLSESGEDAEAEDTWDQIESPTNRINAIEQSRTCVYEVDVKARCGVVISVGHNGEVELIRGLMRREDQAELGETEVTGDAAQPEATRPEAAQECGYSAVLVEVLTQHKTAAIAVELTRQPRTALAATVHAMVLRQFGPDLGLYRAKSCLDVSTTQADLNEAVASPALVLLEEQSAEWARRLPTTADDLWQWCLDRDEETLRQLLAYCVARSLNAVKSKVDADRDRLQHSNALALALQLDMTTWFKPTAENFFGRVSKSQIAECLKEAGKPLSGEAMKLKKADLAALAEREIQGIGWLPEPIRVSLDDREVFASKGDLSAA